MKSLAGQFLVIGLATIVAATVLRSVRNERDWMAGAAGAKSGQETAIPLSRQQPSIRPVSTGEASPIAQAGQTTASETTIDDSETRFEESGMTRLRQGKPIKDPNAVFQIVGERISCNLSQYKLSVIALENLTLERVHHYLMRGGSNPTWEVEGVITEYEGANYLLLERAIVNSLELDE